ncbi:heme transporter hrg1-A-like [Watersipora subatra]|uniref:heme transporter hrg1-A-like n=1 Tax=Watersipora subatra TaxID=2589382 RepID=UPI00355BD3D0
MPRFLGNFTCKIVFAVIGMVVGLSAAGCFGPVLQNPDAAGFGLLSGIVAGITLAVHVMHRRRRWSLDSDGSLIALQYTGVVIQMLSAAAFIVYMVLGCLTAKDGFHVYGRNYFLTCVWCFMSWKWGFLLFLYCRRYRKELTMEEDYAPIQE